LQVRFQYFLSRLSESFRKGKHLGHHQLLSGLVLYQEDLSVCALGQWLEEFKNISDIERETGQLRVYFGLFAGDCGSIDDFFQVLAAFTVAV
jgi:hypothetical protein